MISASTFAAFGLTVTCQFCVPGVVPGRAAGGRETHVEAVDDAELSRIWSAVKVSSDARVLRHDEELGHLLDLPEAGRFSVSPDGRLIRCAPCELEPWRWQRGLFAGALPFAALIQGIEVFHASAVVLDGRLIAITAESGGGKSTLAAFLRLAGASFFTDDVLALESRGGQVMAHPGPPLLNLRRTTRELLSSGEARALGSVLGEDELEARLVTTPFPEPAPLSALYFLERRRDAGRVSFEAVTDAPRWLLAASYNFVIRTPDRLLGQLDLCSRLAAGAELARVVAPVSIDAHRLADALAGHATRA
jgi:hypothetical protein